MNVEIGAEAALFPEKEYINGIFAAVWVFVYKSSSVCSGSEKGVIRPVEDLSIWLDEDQVSKKATRFQ